MVLFSNNYWTYVSVDKICILYSSILEKLTCSIVGVLCVGYIVVAENKYYLLVSSTPADITVHNPSPQIVVNTKLYNVPCQSHTTSFELRLVLLIDRLPAIARDPVLPCLCRSTDLTKYGRFGWFPCPHKKKFKSFWNIGKYFKNLSIFFFFWRYKHLWK